MDINSNSYFSQGVAHLLIYQTTHGNMDIDEEYMSSDRFPLGEFVSEVRTAENEGIINAEQRSRLKNIGFAFEKQEQPWDTLYAIAKEYIEKHDGNLPKATERTSEDILIGAWVREQKLTYLYLSKSKQQLLDDIGIAGCEV